MLQLKKDLLRSVFGQDRAAALLEQVVSSVRDRDLLHNSLLQRKSKLQVGVPGLPGREGGGLHSCLSCTTGRWVACPLPLSPRPQLLGCTPAAVNERAFSLVS